jgi:hypothetical protein
MFGIALGGGAGLDALRDRLVLDARRGAAGSGAGSWRGWVDLDTDLDLDTE